MHQNSDLQFNTQTLHLPSLLQSEQQILNYQRKLKLKIQYSPNPSQLETKKYVPEEWNLLLQEQVCQHKTQSRDMLVPPLLLSAQFCQNLSMSDSARPASPRKGFYHHCSHPTATKHHTPDSSTPQMQHKVNKRSFTCIENSLIKMSSNQKLTCMVRLLTFLIITYLNYFLTN